MATLRYSEAVAHAVPPVRATSTAGPRAARRRERVIAIVGGLLVVGYVAQAVLGLEWPALVALQATARYKVASGTAVLALFGYQSLLGARRTYDPVGSVARHQWVGALAPIVLYLHAARFGYGYLAVLAVSYLGTVALGVLSRAAASCRARSLYTLWFVTHAALASALVVLAAYHAVIAIAYE